MKQEAWKLVFSKKYDALAAFIDALDKIADILHDTARLDWISTLEVRQQPIEIMSFIRDRYGADYDSKPDPVPRYAVALMPPPGAIEQALAAGDYNHIAALLERQARGVVALKNLLQEEYHKAQDELSRAKSKLLLTITDPTYVNDTIDEVAKLFHTVFNPPEIGPRMDPEATTDVVALRFGPIYSELRRELQRSSRGLRSATVLTWRWKFSERGYRDRIATRLFLAVVVGFPAVLFWTFTTAYYVGPPVHETGHLLGGALTNATPLNYSLWPPEPYVDYPSTIEDSALQLTLIAILGPLLVSILAVGLSLLPLEGWPAALARSTAALWLFLELYSNVLPATNDGRLLLAAWGPVVHSLLLLLAGAAVVWLGLRAKAATQEWIESRDQPSGVASPTPRRELWSKEGKRLKFQEFIRQVESSSWSDDQRRDLKIQYEGLLSAIEHEDGRRWVLFGAVLVGMSVILPAVFVAPNDIVRRLLLALGGVLSLIGWAVIWRNNIYLKDRTLLATAMQRVVYQNERQFWIYDDKGQIPKERRAWQSAWSGARGISWFTAWALMRTTLLASAVLWAAALAWDVSGGARWILPSAIIAGTLLGLWLGGETIVRLIRKK